MKHSSDRILTTHVGSLPRPPGLVDMILNGALYGTPEQRAAFDVAAAAAVGDAVAKQIAAGIDIVSDGEQSKPGFANYIKDRLAGFQGQSHSEFRFADLKDFGIERPLPEGNWAPACTGPVHYEDRVAYLGDIDRFRTALASHAVCDAFMCAVSPGTVAQVIVNQYYASRREYLLAVSEAMHEEYKAFTDAGLLVQLDACDLAMDRHDNFANSTLGEFRDIIEENVEVLNTATEGIPTDQIRLHVCWGNYVGPHHKDVPLADIIDIVLKVRCGAIAFEAANPRHGHEWTVWRDVVVRDDLILIPGVIDTATAHIEHPELVAQRIEQYADIVGPERVIAGTDCGFGTFVGSQRPERTTYAKLSALAEGARLASQRLF